MPLSRILLRKMPLCIMSIIIISMNSSVNNFLSLHFNTLVRFTQFWRKLRRGKFYQIEFWGQCCKTFFVRNLRIFLVSQSVCPGKPFQSRLMIAGKAGVYPNEAPFRCSTLGQAPGHTHKQQTRVEKLARDKHSSLLK